MSISKKQRFEVFKRDRFTCQYCGNQPPDCVLELEHIHPKSQGGTDDYSNLTTACFDCNRGKSDRLLSDNECDNVSAMQVETIAQLTAMNKMLQQSRHDSQHMLDDLCAYMETSLDWHPGSVTRADRASISRFMSKLNFEEVCDAIDSTASRCSSSASSHAQFKYFCGVCWCKIRERNGGE